MLHEHIYVETKHVLCVHFEKKMRITGRFESQDIDAQSYCRQILNIK